MNDIESIWFRRPGAVHSAEMPQKWVEGMIENETKYALGGIFRTLECLMVNNPASDAESLYKLYQLRLARDVGFFVPDTVVTSDPVAAAEFYEKCGREVIYKLVAENSNFYFPNFQIPAGIPALPLRPSEAEHFEQVKCAPHLFQRRVRKKFDVRTTVVGREMFSLKIDSQARGSRLDWRLDYSVPMEMIDLPNEISEKCLSIMRRMKLNYAAFDFCVDDDDRYFFLELNCAGQYLWAEQRGSASYL